MLKIIFSFLILSLLISCTSIYTPEEPKKKKVVVNTAQDRMKFEQRMKKLREKRTAKLANKFKGETEARKKAEAERLLQLQNNTSGRASFYAMRSKEFLYKEENLTKAYIYSKKALELDPNNKEARKVHNTINNYYRDRNKILNKLDSKQKKQLLKELKKMEKGNK